MSLLTDYCIWHKKNGELQGLIYNPQARKRSQEREPLYLENGSIYIVKPEILKKYNIRLGGKIEMFEMDFWKSHEIDTPSDVDICEYYFKHNIIGL